MTPLGINVGISWAPPLAAVLDSKGTVVWQSQGVSNWSGIRPVCEQVR